MDGWTDRQMDRWMDRWTDGWMDRKSEIEVDAPPKKAPGGTINEDRTG